MIFNKKIMSQATRPPIISLVVWSALIQCCRLCFASWLIDGPQLMLASLRQIDMLTVLSLLYLAFIATSSTMVSGARCWGAMKLAGGAAVATAGAGSGDGQRCAAAGGDAERTAARRGALIMAGLYINVFGLRLVRPGMARG